MTVLFEPASAIAAGICLTARSLNDRRYSTRHERPCGWCEYSADELRRLIDGFNEWAGFRERTGTYERHDVRLFSELPRAEQRRLVLEAQAFEPEPDAPASPPAGPAEEVPSWIPS